MITMIHLLAGGQHVDESWTSRGSVVDDKPHQSRFTISASANWNISIYLFNIDPKFN